MLAACEIWVRGEQCLLRLHRAEFCQLRERMGL